MPQTVMHTIDSIELTPMEALVQSIRHVNKGPKRGFDIHLNKTPWQWLEGWGGNSAVLWLH